METLIALKFVLASVEESIRAILMIGREYNIELFKSLLKKIVYDILIESDYVHGVMNIISKLCISYDIGNNINDEDIDNDDIEVNIEIPINEIILSLKRMIDRGEVYGVYNESELMMDIDLIEDIWDGWVPSNNFILECKNMVNYIEETL